MSFNRDPIADVIPLTSCEKLRKEQLEAIVGAGLERFLECGAALSELRNRRLYRTEFATFEEYVKSKFGLHRSSVDGVIRSAQTAQVLLDAGIQLPLDTTPTSLRAISALPGDELKSACWQLAQSLSPARAPSQPLVSRLCRLVRKALEDCESVEDGNGHKPRKREHPWREVAFIAPVRRLARYQSFDANLVISHVEALPSALNIYTALGIMVNRCEAARAELAKRFPECLKPSAQLSENGSRVSGGGRFPRYERRTKAV